MSLIWSGRSLSAAVRRLRAGVELGEFATMLKLTPPQIDTVVFRCDGQILVAFGGGLPALAQGDAVTWRGRQGQVILVANAADTVSELTERALAAPTGSVGKGLARVARLLHLDEALDRLGAPEWLLLMSDWGPYEAATESLADVDGDWPVGLPLS